MDEQSIFMEALDRDTPSERAAYLNEACGDNAALRRRIAALLRSHEEAGDFLVKSVPDRLSEDLTHDEEKIGMRADCDRTGTSEELSVLCASARPDSLGRLAHYEALEIVGRGSMGMVLKVFDESLHRIVAVKMMAPQLAASATARKRFVREARAAAAVRNEHVVSIHAVEEIHGLPYLVMEYIAGVSLQERLDKAAPLEVREILRIGLQAAAGLAAAHAQGLIHRDIKPANILLENGVARVKLTDFGLARAVDDASLTRSGVVAGTPLYMAPEQAKGELVDHRADLFSLGSVLYAMCTGRSPFRASGMMAVLKRVCEDTPRSIREINPEIPDWLTQIIGKLHAKNPVERYQSAAKVAELLGKHLANYEQSAPMIPALDGPSMTNQERGLLNENSPSATPRPRFAKSKPHRRMIAAALAALLLAGIGFSEAIGVTRFTGTVLRVLTPAGTLVVEVDDPSIKVTVEGDGDITVTGAGPQEVRLRPGSYRLLASKDGKPIRDEVVTVSRNHRRVVRVSMEGGEASLTFPPGPLDGLDPLRIPPEERFSWQPPELVALFGSHRQRHWGRVLSVAWSADGRRIASGGEDFVIRIWDAATMREQAVLRGHANWVQSVAFAPDGRHVLSGSKDGTLRWWDVTTGSEMRRFVVGAQVTGVVVASDGRRVLSSAEDHTVRLWDVETAKELRRFTGHTNHVDCVSISPDGLRVLSGSSDRTARLWELKSGRELRCLEGHSGHIHSVAFSPDGRRALSGTAHANRNGADVEARDYHVRLWDLESGKELRRFEGHAHPVQQVAFAPDGHRAISCGNDGTIRLWDVERGKELANLSGSGRPVLSIALAPDGARVVSGNADGTLRLWDLDAGKELRPITGPVGATYGAIFTQDGRRILSGGGDKKLRLWDVTSGKETRTFIGHSDPIVSLAVSSDGRRALSGSEMSEFFVPQPPEGDRSGPWRLWDVETGKQLLHLPGPSTGGAGCVAISPDSQRALTSCEGQVLLWDLRSGRELREFGTRGNYYVSCVAISPDLGTALIGDWHSTVRVWDMKSGKELRSFQGHTSAIHCVAYSPDGRFAASSSGDKTIRLWDLIDPASSGRVFLKWHTGGVMSVAFAPDGKTLASSGSDGRIILWDVAGGDKLREWQLTGPVHGVCFAPDGRHLATANGNGTVYILRLARP